MADFDVQQVARDAAIETWDTDEPSEGQVDTMVLGIAVIVPAVTQQIRALHVRHSDTCECFARDAEGLCFIAGTCDGCSGMPEHPCPTVRVLDEIESRSAVNATKTHCPKGHLLTPENNRTDRAKIGERACRKCAQEYERRRHVATTLAKNALGLSRPQYHRMYGGGLPTALSILADLSLLDQPDAAARGEGS